MGEQSSQSDDRVSVNEHCAKNFRSLVEGEIKTKAEVGKESIVNFPGGPSSSGGAAYVLGQSRCKWLNIIEADKLDQTRAVTRGHSPGWIPS